MMYYISFVDLFYIPSFLRGEGGSRMEVLEPWKSVGRPRGSQGEGMNALTHRFEEQHVNHMKASSSPHDHRQRKHAVQSTPHHLA